MSFLLPLFGAAAGALGGFSLGEVMRVGVDGTAIDVRYLLTMFGVLVGNFGGRLLARSARPKEV